MLLTTKQVAQKLGVRPPVVGRLVRTGKLACANADAKATADRRMHYEFDPKVVREFAATYVPIPHVIKKPKGSGNGHAPEMLPLDIPSVVALANALARIEDKLDTLLAVWK